jgi:hypothetical protein
MQRLEMRYRSTQASLWEEEEVKWLKVLQLPAYVLRHHRGGSTAAVVQISLFA